MKTINIMVGIVFLLITTQALVAKEKTKIKKVKYKSDKIELVGNLYLPKNYKKKNKYNAVLVLGSWTTVKEQMAGLYAKKLAKNDFIALAFDPRGFGESDGVPRYYENPDYKIRDVINTAEYLSKRKDVKSIGAMGICAGSGYVLVAASKSEKISAVVTVASWIHDEEAVKLFYGGEEGVQQKIDQSIKSREVFEKTGKVEYVKTISTEDKSAAMYGDYDYYLNPDRGAISEWSSDKFAVMSWEKWLDFNPMPSAEKLDKPILMIHSDGAVLPDYTKKYFQDIKTKDKKLIWFETQMQSPMHQFSFYDQNKEVEESIINAVKWYRDKLSTI